MPIFQKKVRTTVGKACAGFFRNKKFKKYFQNFLVEKVEKS